jgi:hypothetical protein
VLYHGGGTTGVAQVITGRDVFRKGDLPAPHGGACSALAGSCGASVGGGYA